MLQIRQSIFETNSSSSHSISISEDSDGILDTIEPWGDKLYLTGGEFGRNWSKHNDPLTKANFIAVSIEEWGKDKKEAQLKMLSDVICEHIEVSEVRLNFKLARDDYENGTSYVDHQSCDVYLSALKSRKSLNNFIFNPKSFLVCGSDEHCPPPNMLDRYDLKYRWALILEGSNQIYKFVKKPNKKELSFAFSTLVEYHPVFNRNLSYEDRFYFYGDERGEDIDSLVKSKQSIVSLYKAELRKQENGVYRYAILATKELKFKLVKI